MSKENIKKPISIQDQKYLRTILAILSLTFTIVALWIVVDSFNNKYTDKNLTLSYKVNSEIDYNVNYKENEFYSNDYVPSGTEYLSALINNVDIKLSYSMSSSKLMNSSYKYSVETIFVSNYVEGKKITELLKNSNELVPHIEHKLIRTSEVNIEEYVSIDYEKYNEEVLKFQNKFNIETDSYLLVRLNVENESTVFDVNKTINNGRSIELKIPLGKSVVSISKKLGNNISEHVYANNVVEADFNYVLFAMAIIILAFSLPLFVISVARLFVITNVTDYERLKRKYLKNNGDIIAEVESLPNLKGKEVINIKTFDDLVDIEEELRKPILFNEVVKDRESCFLVTDGDKAYRYVLKAKIEKKSLVGKKIDNFQE